MKMKKRLYLENHLESLNNTKPVQLNWFFIIHIIHIIHIKLFMTFN